MTKITDQEIITLGFISVVCFFIGAFMLLGLPGLLIAIAYVLMKFADYLCEDKS